MNITRNNFYDLLPVINDAVNAADFLCIDSEFSGLTNGSYKIALFDSPDERYHKLCSNTANFLLMQFGKKCWCLMIYQLCTVWYLRLNRHI